MDNEQRMQAKREILAVHIAKAKQTAKDEGRNFEEALADILNNEEEYQRLRHEAENASVSDTDPGLVAMGLLALDNWVTQVQSGRELVW